MGFSKIQTIEWGGRGSDTTKELGKSFCVTQCSTVQHERETTRQMHHRLEFFSMFSADESVVNKLFFSLSTSTMEFPRWLLSHAQRARSGV